MGHLFVVHGDLTRLACDALMIACDSSMNVNRVWAEILPEGLPPGDDDWLRLQGVPNDSNVIELEERGGRQIHAYVALDGQATPVDIVNRLWTALKDVSTGLPAAGGRHLPLIGVPLPGVGSGGLRHDRGKVIEELLARHRTSNLRCDVALVLWDRRDLAAIQARRGADNDWPELSRDLLDQADRLGDLARNGQLSLFLGAGISRPAGLPSWDDLLERLAMAADRPRPQGLSPEEAATELRDALGDRYHDTLTELFDVNYHAVGHALLASLRVPQMITTNFDPCLELALDRVHEGDYRVLARQLAAGSAPWLLKLNGDIKVPQSVVLTAEEFDRHKEDSRALRGVVQALLLTSHLLFVGYSLREESFLEMANEVTHVRSRALCDEQQAVGTAIALTRRPDGGLPYQDLLSVSMDTDDIEKGARLLEIFLDRLCWRVASSEEWAAQYLLDDDYLTGLRSNERALRNAILGFLEGLDDNAKSSPGWPRISEVLSQLGGDPNLLRDHAP